MGYRGKLAERQQARQLRRAGLPLAEIAARLGVSKSSVSLWVRDVEFEPRAGPSRGRRRAPNALQRRRQAEIDRLVEEGRARIGRLSDREFLVAGSRCTRGRAARGWSPPLRQQRSPHDRVLLLLVTTVLRGRRVAVAGPPLPPRRPGSGRRHRLLVGADRDPAFTVREAVPGGARSLDPSCQACAWLPHSQLQLQRHSPKRDGSRERLAEQWRHSGVAQPAEHLTVNQRVASSSLAPGASAHGPHRPRAVRIFSLALPPPGAHTTLDQDPSASGPA
jgi:hypothetical protein